MTPLARISIVSLLALTLAACNDKPSSYQGWVEANLIFVAPDEAGRVETLAVREGDPVTTGAPLFGLDAELQRAEVNQTMAAVTNARATFERAQQLVKTGSGTQRAFDEAQAELRTAEARLAAAQTKLGRRVINSPVTGTVQQVYFRPGEMVPASRPIVALLPPGNLKIRFFVPEATLPLVSYGDRITVKCDNCPGDLTATISFISRSAEFTPPVIYSLEERAKLVFLIEALPEQPEKFRVGQPVDVVLAGQGAKK
jgi:HlyD family secretion protein